MNTRMAIGLGAGFLLAAIAHGARAPGGATGAGIRAHQEAKVAATEAVLEGLREIEDSGRAPTAEFLELKRYWWLKRLEAVTEAATDHQERLRAARTYLERVQRYRDRIKARQRSDATETQLAASEYWLADAKLRVARLEAE